MKQFIQLSKTILVSLVVVLSAMYVQAEWNNPTSAPIGGNTPTPINVSNSQQDKEGKLTASVLGADSLCLTGVGCIEAWPSGGGSGDVTNNYSKGQWCGFANVRYMGVNFISGPDYSSYLQKPTGCEYEGVSYYPGVISCQYLPGGSCTSTIQPGCPNGFNNTAISFQEPTGSTGDRKISFSCIKQ